MTKKKFKKVVILDTVIFYPEHRAILQSLAEEILEYPSSLPEGLERQYTEQPELFRNIKCYTELGADQTPLQLLMNRIEGADVVISCWTGIPDEILRLNPQLKLIIFWTHEKEHRINVSLAEELGMTVKNIPDYGTEAVAEAVFAGLWELWLRTKPASHANETSSSHAIMREIFRRFRKLDVNEKNTRAGKFSHHFHKLGMASFNFTKDTLDDLIPEKLIEAKRIGLLNLDLTPALQIMGSAFHLKILPHVLGDSDAAAYYKFLTEQDLVFFDRALLTPAEIQKAQTLIGDRFVDVQGLPSTGALFTHQRFGVIGLGRIGLRVATIARQLGFEVVYSARNRKPDLEASLGIAFCPLEELMKTSDVISLHVSAHKADQLLTAELIQSMKIAAYFINTADGNALDQKALTERMLKNEVYAFLDVYPGLPRKDVLGIPMLEAADWKLKRALPQHVLAYRAGWRTQESIRVKTYKLLGQMVDYLNALK
ncbi:MAG: NAD(P)-dependent oxidoreductase, partial [Candidatus Uhrbacteria bacterium]|nr:NAD(P)-dependent oxidoreductase [Candidatus Uhrbacteria bacterium]